MCLSQAAAPGDVCTIQCALQALVLGVTPHSQVMMLPTATSTHFHSQGATLDRGAQLAAASLPRSVAALSFTLRTGSSLPLVVREGNRLNVKKGLLTSESHGCFTNFQRALRVH